MIPVYKSNLTETAMHILYGEIKGGEERGEETFYTFS